MPISFVGVGVPAPCEAGHDVGVRSEEWTFDKQSATVTLTCNASDAYAIAGDLINNFRSWPFSGAPAMYAKRANISYLESAATTDGQANVYVKAKITVTYESLEGFEDGTFGGADSEAEADDEGLFTIEIEPAAEHIRIPVFRPATKLITDMDDPGYGIITNTVDDSAPPVPLFRWTDVDGDPLDESEAPTKLIHTTDYVITWTRLGRVRKLDELLAATNHVNDQEETILGQDCPAGTLLMNGPRIKRSTTSSGTTWDLQIRLSYRPDTWNKFWRAKTGTFEPIVWAETAADHAAGDEYLNFPEADLSTWIP